MAPASAVAATIPILMQPPPDAAPSSQEDADQDDAAGGHLPQLQRFAEHEHAHDRGDRGHEIAGHRRPCRACRADQAHEHRHRDGRADDTESKHGGPVVTQGQKGRGPGEEQGQQRGAEPGDDLLAEREAHRIAGRSRHRPDIDVACRVAQHARDHRQHAEAGGAAFEQARADQQGDAGKSDQDAAEAPPAQALLDEDQMGDDGGDQRAGRLDHRRRATGELDQGVSRQNVRNPAIGRAEDQPVTDLVAPRQRALAEPAQPERERDRAEQAAPRRDGEGRDLSAHQLDEQEARSPENGGDEQMDDNEAAARLQRGRSLRSGSRH